ncbi:MAG TPA: tyrosine-type recombinase/integrase [Gallionella sp.]
MSSMGRKPTVNLNLPPRMRARARGNKVHYYFDAGGKPRKEIPLGSDYALAVKKWTELQIDQPQPETFLTFRKVAERYVREILPGKAPRTQADNLTELKFLYRFFDNPPAMLDSIRPIHVRQYMDWRNPSKVRANREKALFSHIWNMARDWGYTDLPNPCAGIKGYSETGRKDIYIEETTYIAVHGAASQPLRDAMDMAYLTGQRPADVLKMTEADLRDSVLHITQGKTKTKLRIRIEGDLAILIERILARKIGHKIRSLYLIVDDHGQRYTYPMLRAHFDTAREAAGVAKATFQFRDLRAKAATDKTESSGDIRQAQKQLGHTTVTMTEHYVRGRRGEKVGPTK